MKSTIFFKALGDDTRVRLLNLLIAFEMNVGEVVRTLDMGQSRISRHLKILADSGLLECRRDGLWAFYRAARSGPGAGFIACLRKILAADDALLRDLDRAAQVMAERRQATSRFFDRLAGAITDINREILGDFDLAGELAARAPADGVIADLGCASGELLARLIPHSTGVIGVDGSPKMLELAGQRLRDVFTDASGRQRVSLRIGDLNHLPIKDGEADAAVLSMVLHHVDDPASVLAETARTLRQGGRLLVAEFNRHADESLRREHGDRHLGIAPEEMRGWLAEAGFPAPDITTFPVNRGLQITLYDSVKPTGR